MVSSTTPKQLDSLGSEAARRTRWMGKAECVTVSSLEVGVIEAASVARKKIVATTAKMREKRIVNVRA
ncbi:hypothetical protein PsorP6_001946 [Peronosclerospora sorghi]|uniref:Uncharacterized protein n=1 Tax=Peronosclerospora sorghi TaxID=230839 RepID=A0ACC0WW62_9STRA|nr:hypothetical protein PsorP6_001946 [Peronosclerospora sorghi]